MISLPTGAVLVQLRGELDMAFEATMRDQFTCAVRLSPHLLVDMRQVEFIDCAGLRAMLWGRERAMAQGGSFGLVAPSRAVRRLLELARVEEAFPVHADLRRAVARS
jgi:anti-anti-sigma factor